MHDYFSGDWESDLASGKEGVRPSRGRFLPEKRVSRQGILHGVSEALLSQALDAKAEWGAGGGVRHNFGQLARTDNRPVQSVCQQECNSLVWLYPCGCTDVLQPNDAGLGALRKGEIGNHLDLWLGNGNNLERRQSNALTASDRRFVREDRDRDDGGRDM